MQKIQLKQILTVVFLCGRTVAMSRATVNGRNGNGGGNGNGNGNGKVSSNEIE